MLVKHSLRLLMLVALLIAPLGMLGGTSVAASPVAEQGASGGHCEEMAASHEKAPDRQAPSKSADCLLDCMVLCSGMPSMPVQLAEPMPRAALPMAVPPSAAMSGLTPQAEPRPPRVS